MKKKVMEFSIDTNKIVKLVIEKEKGVLLEYRFENGLIVEVNAYGESTCYNPSPNKVLNDTEMIEKIRQSDFMDELNDARKRFKLSKEIEESFPEHDDAGNYKRPKEKTSDESLGAIKEIIKMDLDGTLDEIASRNSGRIAHNLAPDEENDATYDYWRCQENVKRIENKLLQLMRKKHGDNLLDDKEFASVLEDYKNYSLKKDKLFDEAWKKKTK